MMVLQSLQKRKSPVTVVKQSPGYVRRLVLLKRKRRPAEELSAERLKTDKEGYKWADSIRIRQTFLRLRNMSSPRSETITHVLSIIVKNGSKQTSYGFNLPP
jgi:hypothetical protein